jgi:hypothetical protein
VVEHNTVLQLSPKVVKLLDKIDTDQRFQALERQIAELKNHFFFQTKANSLKNPKTDGLGRIRTGDLRRVKAPFRNLSPC